MPKLTDHPLPRLIIPYLVLTVSLLLSGAVTAYVANSTAAKDRARFEAGVERTGSAIRQRIETYVNMLRGAAGLLEVNKAIDRAAFGRYVARLQLRERYPGIQGIGISTRVKAADKDALEARMRREWQTPFTVHPVEPREEYYAITYLEPPDERNMAALGFDMFTEPVRRAAMEKARDTGEAASSGRVTLMQEVDPARTQSGFLIYLPFYSEPGVPETVERRRETLAGFVYAPFRVGDLLAGVFGSADIARVTFSVHDPGEAGSVSSGEALLYRSEDFDSPEQGEARFTMTAPLQIPGRQWMIRYRSGATLESGSPHWLAMLTMGLGVAVSFLLFALSAAQAAAQHRAERGAEDLRRSEQRLRASESRFRRLADSNLIGVAFANIDGRVTEANDEYLRIVGRTPEQLLAGEVRWDEMAPPDGAQAKRQIIESLLRDGSCPPFEKYFVRPDGSYVPVLAGLAMMEGSRTEMVGFYVDLEKQKQAEREIVRAKEAADAARMQAEEASRLKDEFLATVSHELRTPLNAILGWAQLLRDGRTGPEDVQHGLTTIERSAKAQSQLIDDLLDVSRIVAGKLRLDVKLVRPIEVVEAALVAIRPAADAKRIRLIHVLDPDAGPVNGDSARLQQIVWNLLTNAVKFTPRSGVVQVLLKREDGCARISVIDDGVGIAPAFLPHVFDRFRQADASTTRRFGGLGLGLGIVRHLTELHGGTVHADSPGEGKGAAFTIDLPLAVPRAGTAAAADPMERRDGVSLQGVRIMLVEDDVDARDLMTHVLRDRGAQVIAAGSAAEAMDAFELLAPHVLISDIGMPDEDGYTLLARIRARGPERGGNVPAIALTALARPEDRRRAAAAGFQIHVAKPVEPSALASVIADLAKPKTPAG